MLIYSEARLTGPCNEAWTQLKGDVHIRIYYFLKQRSIRKKFDRSYPQLHVRILYSCNFSIHGVMIDFAHLNACLCISLADYRLANLHEALSIAIHYTYSRS